MSARHQEYNVDWSLRQRMFHRATATRNDPPSGMAGWLRNNQRDVAEPGIEAYITDQAGGFTGKRRRAPIFEASAYVAGWIAGCITTLDDGPFVAGWIAGCVTTLAVTGACYFFGGWVAGLILRVIA